VRRKEDTGDRIEPRRSKSECWRMSDEGEECSQAKLLARYRELKMNRWWARIEILLNTDETKVDEEIRGRRRGKMRTLVNSWWWNERGGKQKLTALGNRLLYV
jgi:hypothetical protein